MKDSRAVSEAYENVNSAQICALSEEEIKVVAGGGRGTDALFDFDRYVKLTGTAAVKLSPDAGMGVTNVMDDRETGRYKGFPFVTFAAHK